MITEDLATSMSEQFDRMSLQENNIFDVPPPGVLKTHTQQAAIHLAMKISSRKSSNRGFLVWLNPTVINIALLVGQYFFESATI